MLTTIGRIIYNDRIERALAEALGDEFDPSKYTFVNQSMKKRDTTRLIDLLVQSYGATTISLVLDAFKDLGLQVRDAGRDHDLQERRRGAAGEAGDPRQVRGAGGRHHRPVRRWA